MAENDDLAIPAPPATADTLVGGAGPALAADDAPIPITPVIGYRQLNAAELAWMNEGKQLAEQVGAFVKRVQMLPKAPVPEVVASELACHDPRWAAIAATQLQQGFMALLRSLARPTTF